MKLAVKLLFPSLPVTSCNYFKGFVHHNNNEIIVYITTVFTNKHQLSRLEINKFESNVIYGLCGNGQELSHNRPKKFAGKCSNWLSLKQMPRLVIRELILNGKQTDISHSVIIFYNHDEIVKSEVKWEYEDVFSKIQKLVQTEHKNFNYEDATESLLTCSSWMKSSMLLQHTIGYINVLYWTLFTIKRDKKISIKHGNFILSIMVDLLLGYIVLQFLKQDKKELSVFLMSTLEKMINMLYSLLKWLMGAPAGLKLNNAFNKMLGKYFSYHVQLWWLFFDVTGEKLSVILDIFNYLGYLGFTFQAAVISDLISIVTFHSFCIYVYAARMFNIQISGLIALLRFFVGRKYNPLRECIDSCEYTNEELFVGTVAFTILLLLLPTTAMYYTVFTLFRLLTLLVQHALAKLIYLIHTLPLYVTGLWLIRSPKVAGNILLEMIDSTKATSPLLIKLKLFNKSLFYLVKNFRPPCDVPNELIWTKMLSNIFIGKPIV